MPSDSDEEEESDSESEDSDELEETSHFLCFLLACLVFELLGIDINVSTCDVSETCVLYCPKT